MSFTIVLKFSRDWCIEPFFEIFNLVEFNRKDCNLVIINNTTFNKITAGLMMYISSHCNKFKSVKFYQSNSFVHDRYTGDNFYKVPIPFHTWTAYYSFQLQKLINKLVEDDIHIQLEDDTLIHLDTIPKLLKLMERENCVCATSPVPHRQKGFDIVGHNAYDKLTFDDKGFLLARSNYPVYRSGIRECDATGYCNLAFRKKPFEEAIKYLENLAFRIIGSGSDIYFTNHMKKNGLKILCDFSIWGEHLFVEDNVIKKNTLENCKPWDWKWNKDRSHYDLKFIEVKVGRGV